MSDRGNNEGGVFGAGDVQDSLPRRNELRSVALSASVEAEADPDFLQDPDPVMLAAAKRARAVARRSAERQSSSSLLALPQATFSKHS
jgi:hypothetical protein